MSFNKFYHMANLQKVSKLKIAVNPYDILYTHPPATLQIIPNNAINKKTPSTVQGKIIAHLFLSL